MAIGIEYVSDRKPIRLTEEQRRKLIGMQMIGFRWICQDRSGIRRAFVSKPKLMEDGWMTRLDGEIVGDPMICFRNLTTNWWEPLNIEQALREDAEFNEQQ